MLRILSKGTPTVRDPAEATTLVPKASVVMQGGVPAKAVAVLNHPACADGLVSYQRLVLASAGADISTGELAALNRAMDVAVNAHAALNQDDRLNTQLEARATQVQNDISTYSTRIADDRDWAGTGEAAQTVAALRDNWTIATSAVNQVMTQFGVHHALWYAAYAGRAAAVDKSLSTFERTFAEAVKVAVGKGTFAADIEGLDRAQQLALQGGLEAAHHAGVSFFVKERSYSWPPAQMIAAILDGKAIYASLGTYGGSDVHTSSFGERRELESLGDLIAVIKKYAKLDVSQQVKTKRG